MHPVRQRLFPRFTFLFLDLNFNFDKGLIASLLMMWRSQFDGSSPRSGPMKLKFNSVSYWTMSKFGAQFASIARQTAVLWNFYYVTSNRWTRFESHGMLAVPHSCLLQVDVGVSYSDVYKYRPLSSTKSYHAFLFEIAFDRTYPFSLAREPHTHYILYNALLSRYTC